ncbi:oligogalacturonide transporter [Bifidobacterium ramosum]|nr:MFS transporter [Bifidobacterium ramosum]KAB8287325.1 oligogalacturonide transporter [Bifidobacterium ramosum]
MTSTSVASSGTVETGRLSSWTKIAYAFFGLSFTMSTMVNTWQMFYYTSFMAIGVGVVTTMLAFGKWAGAAISPVWGWLSDRMYSTSIGRKLGRRRAMLLILAPLNLLFYVLLWLPNMPVWAYILFNVGYFAIWPGVTTIDYALPSEMTDNSKDRAQLVVGGQIGGAVGSFGLSMLNVYLFNIWGNKTWDAYFKIAMLYAVVGTILLVLAAFAIKERPYDPSTDVAAADKDAKGKTNALKQIVSVFWNFVSVIRIRTFRNYLYIFLTQIIFRNVRGTLNSYFIIFVLMLTAQDVSLSTGISFLFGIAFVTFWGWATSKVGGLKTYRAGGYITFVLFGLILVMGLLKQNFTPTQLAIGFTVLITAFGLGNSGIVNAQQYIQAFVPDVDEIVTGKRREGQYAGITETLSTVVQALVVAGTGWVLVLFGFQSGSETQPASAVNALLYMYCLTPMVLTLLGNFLTYRMHLNDENHKVLVAEAKRLREGGSMADVTPETRKVVEDLAGMKYEECWGHNNIINISNRG